MALCVTGDSQCLSLGGRIDEVVLAGRSARMSLRTRIFASTTFVLEYNQSGSSGPNTIRWFRWFRNFGPNSFAVFDNICGRHPGNQPMNASLMGCITNEVT